MTGVNFLAAELVAKRLELLRELVPRIERVAVLVNPDDAIAYRDLRCEKWKLPLAPWGCKSRS